jgi:hypothetical protein
LRAGCIERQLAYATLLVGGDVAVTANLTYDTLVLLLHVENKNSLEKRIVLSREFLPECSTKYTYYAIYNCFRY